MRYLLYLVVATFGVLNVYAQPTIPSGQTRAVLSSAAPGANVGDPLFATGTPTSWSIVLEDNSAAGGAVGANELFFTIDNTGQIEVLQPLTALFGVVSGSVTVVLTVQAFNNSGSSATETVDVTVVEDQGGGGPIVLPGQSRSVVTNASVGANVGATVFATGDPDAWAIINEDNSASPNVPANERFFEISNTGQITVLRPLQVFFPGNRAQVTVILTVRAFNATGSGDGDIEINIIEGELPIIFGGQARAIQSTHAPGDPIGDPLEASGNPIFWNIIAGNSIFAINNAGQLTTTAFFDPDSFINNPEVFDLQIVAGNADGTSASVTVSISVLIGVCCYIPATQTRFVSSAAQPDVTIGDPIDIHELDSVWIEEAWIDNYPPDPLVTTYFSIDSPQGGGAGLGQLRVLRPLPNLFDPDLITKINIRIKGHCPILGCPDFSEELVVLYVLPDDAVIGGDPGDPDPGTDFSSLIPDPNLLACIRETLGLAGGSPLTAELVLGLDHLDCLCRSNNAITDLTGLHLFTNLEFLQLSNNLITNIEEIAGLTLLKDLRLANNLITDITTGNPLVSLTLLERLDLSNNQIVETNAFSTLTELSFISIADNNVCSISSLAALANLPGASGLKVGDTVFLDRNHLTSTQALTDIGTIQSAGAFVTATGQTGCTTRIPITLEGFPDHTVIDYTEILNSRLPPNCNN